MKTARSSPSTSAAESTSSTDDGESVVSQEIDVSRTPVTVCPSLKTNHMHSEEAKKEAKKKAKLRAKRRARGEVVTDTDEEEWEGFGEE